MTRDFVVWQPSERRDLVTQGLLDALSRQGARASVVSRAADAPAIVAQSPKTALILVILDGRIPHEIAMRMRETRAGRDLLFICPGAPYDAAEIATAPVVFTFGAQQSQVSALASLLIAGRTPTGTLPVDLSTAVRAGERAS